MNSVLLKALSFMTIILIGYQLKKTKFVPDYTGGVIKKILLNFTLPSAIITNFAKMDSIGIEMLVLTLIGLIVSIFMIVLAVVITRHRESKEKAIYIMSLPSYNIGAFGLPFVQAFLPSAGVMATCMFDVGNSIMCVGVTYAFASAYLSQTNKDFDFKMFWKRLLSSVPLLTYIVMFVITLLHIQVPDALISFIEPVSNASPFTSMLMVGLLMRFEWNKEHVVTIVKIEGLRLLFAVIFSLIFYYLLPFDEVIRGTLVLLSFMPIPVTAPAFTGMCGGDEGVAGCINTISILLCLVIVSILLV